MNCRALAPVSKVLDIRREPCYRYARKDTMNALSTGSETRQEFRPFWHCSRKS